MLQAIKSEIKKLLKQKVRYKNYRGAGRLEKLGSAYGGWIVPVDGLNRDSICYLAGAGEDISFDISLANRFKCTPFIFDPTPKAKAHFQKTMEAARSGQRMSFNGNEWYELQKNTPDHLKFVELGLWDRADKLRFFAPKDDSHVSHSINNLQHTEKYFEAPVDRLSSIMKANGHKRLDLLKIDIEGAEFNVIDTLIEDGIDIGIFCVEFHKEEGEGLEKIQAAVKKLEAAGYRVVAAEHLDFSFVKPNNRSQAGKT